MQSLDEKLINWAGRMAVPLARFAIFLVYFWFGAIKVFAEHGAANPLVTALLEKTMPGFPPEVFIMAFGVFEMIIGVLFIIPRISRLALFLLGVHMVTTIMPLFLLPQYTWQDLFVPTIEGQYIVKNILIISLAVVVWASLMPFKKK